MKETETTRNSRHIDPDHMVAADRVGAKHGSGLHGSTIKPTGWPLFWKTWKSQGIEKWSGKSQGK